MRRRQGHALSRLRRRVTHRYGPHDPDAGPQTVTVFRPEGRGGDVEAPIPEAILEQRRAINTRAHLAAMPAAERPTIYPPDRETYDPHAQGKAARARARQEIQRAQDQAR